MLIRITKGERDDGIEIVRDDGSKAATRFPKKGPIPHDAIHYFVETELRLDHAFWGSVAGGLHPEELGAMAKAAGHASASRAGAPAPSIVELLQAERLVECFEADLWSGEGSNETLIEIAQAACETSLVPMPAMAPAAVDRIRWAIAGFADEWRARCAGESASLYWAGTRLN